MGQLEAALLAAKRDYELLRIEFERTVASNEQAAPIAKELQVSWNLLCTDLPPLVLKARHLYKWLCLFLGLGLPEQAME